MKPQEGMKPHLVIKHGVWHCHPRAFPQYSVGGFTELEAYTFFMRVSDNENCAAVLRHCRMELEKKSKLSAA